MARKNLFGVLFDGNGDQRTIGNEQRATGNWQLATATGNGQLATATGNGNLEAGLSKYEAGQGRGKDDNRNRQRESWDNTCNGP